MAVQNTKVNHAIKSDHSGIILVWIYKLSITVKSDIGFESCLKCNVNRLYKNLNVAKRSDLCIKPFSVN